MGCFLDFVAKPGKVSTACNFSSGIFLKTMYEKKNISLPWAGESKTSSSPWIWSWKTSACASTAPTFMATGALVMLDFFGHTFKISIFSPKWFLCLLLLSRHFCYLLVTFGLRVFPSMLPAWMVVLSSTLGCRQGTLFKAPRNADIQLADSNVFCRNDWWMLNCCKSTVPLPTSQLGAILLFLFSDFSPFFEMFFWKQHEDHESLQVNMWPQKAQPSSAMNMADPWQ